VSGNRSSGKEVRYTFDFGGGKSGRKGSTTAEKQATVTTVPRIARLMALAIRFEGLVREGRIRDYAELARLGSVSRARMTQIMKLLHLAPDIQEEILFSAEIPGLNERNLRVIVRRINWSEQRRMFKKMINRAERHRSPDAY
jgi:hypothetical protein